MTFWIHLIWPNMMSDSDWLTCSHFKNHATVDTRTQANHIRSSSAKHHFTLRQEHSYRNEVNSYAWWTVGFTPDGWTQILLQEFFFKESVTSSAMCLCKKRTAQRLMSTLPIKTKIQKKSLKTLHVDRSCHKEKSEFTDCDCERWIANARSAFKTQKKPEKNETTLFWSQKSVR